MNIQQSTNEPIYEPCFQHVRAYAFPFRREEKQEENEDKKKSNKSNVSIKLLNEGKAIQDSLKPYDGQVLIFDTETTSDNAKELLYGFFQLHGLTQEERIDLYRNGYLEYEHVDTLRESGCFYNPDMLSPEEIALLETYAQNTTLGDIADKLGIPVYDDTDRYELISFITVREFIGYLYAKMRDNDLLIVGHNLPFDISRIALGKTVQSRGDFSGGFSLKLCTCPYDNCRFHPQIIIKHIGFRKNMYRIRHNDPNGGKNRNRNVHFLDTQQLSGALLGKYMSLEKLGTSLNLPGTLRKYERSDSLFTRPITMKDISYASQDVVTTFACWQRLRELYKQHDLSTDIWQMFSSASLGKAYLKEWGYKPFMEVHSNDVSPEIIGYSMNAYYGGRAEIGVRLQPVEIRYYDFKSQYPTVNALMGLNDLLLCKHITVKPCLDKVRSLLAQPDLLERLQDKAFWLQLRCIVKVKPDRDRLPLRTAYGDPTSTNVALPYVKGIPMWYTLSDVIASTLLTGKSPVVLEAYEFVPSKEKYSTTPKSFMGSSDVINPSIHDPFIRVIELRQKYKELARIGDDQQAYHESVQLALKLVANSASYGLPLQINKKDDTERKHSVRYYDANGHVNHTQVHSVETPGEYFSGCLGTLIPASGRLLLAIAERLGSDRGLHYAMCDTDSMAYACPDNMSREDFIQKTQDIADWFQKISPYPPECGNFFELEKENTWQEENEPLFFIGVSAKRYVLYNKLSNGSYRIRKFSAHGLGGIKLPYEDDNSPFPDIPEPCEELKDLGGLRWQYDIWYLFIRSIENSVDLDGKSELLYMNGVPTVNELLLPEPFKQADMYQVSISTWDLYEQYQKIDGIRPFSFFSLLRPIFGLIPFLYQEDINEHNLYMELSNNGTSFYSSASTIEDLRDRARYPIRRCDNNDIMPYSFVPTPISESLYGHFSRSENKAINGKESGVMQPRHMLVVEPLYIGKESYEIKDELQEDTNGMIGEYDTLTYGYGDKPVTNWHDTLMPYKVADLMLLSGLPSMTIYDARSGKIQPEKTTRNKLMEAIYELQHDSKGKISLWRQLPDDQLARLCDVPIAIVKAMKYGKHNFTENEQKNILKYCEKSNRE